MAESTRFVVHLPFMASDVGAARRLARTLARSVAFLPEIESDGVTLSTAEAAECGDRVFCARTVGAGRPCIRRVDHPGRCIVRDR